MTIEGGVDDTRGIQDTGAGTKRKEDPSSSDSGKKHKTSVNKDIQDKAKVIRTKASMGHLVRQAREARLWPRQGSQGFKIAQSQSAVGQERIQYIPPYPSTGQRIQHQFQGAARAPPIKQAGQR